MIVRKRERKKIMKGHDKLEKITFSTNDYKRFYSKVKFSDECWEWTASKSSKGYGLFSIKSKMYSAHRTSFYIENGFLSEAIMHVCDNPSCVKPSHLLAGTIKENNLDRDRKGRQVSGNSLRNECKHGHKFTKDNTYVRPNGKRECFVCKRNQLKNHRNRKVGAQN
jgi:hypothetical protein